MSILSRLGSLANILVGAFGPPTPITTQVPFTGGPGLYGGVSDMFNGDAPGSNTYSGSSVTNTTADFLGDWRSADNWMRFDMLRARNRSRQLERGNPWCRSFKTSLINGVLGSTGFKEKVEVMSSAAFGDDAEGVEDKRASAVIKVARADFGKARNFTTRKKLSRREFDKLLIIRCAFDGEVIIRKIKEFEHNDFGFSWQMIDPDYLDHNLNQLNGETGNYIKMGVELDKDYKFPVAYWFLHRRPTDDQTSAFSEFAPSRYYRVDANEIIHIFLQDLDTEQTRGWPWLFSACVNLHRMGKYEEAALVNATIGASKQGFFKKTTPEGFTPTVGDLAELRESDETGEIIDEVAAGTWTELPWNVEPVPWDPKYPDAEFDPFCKAMLRSIAAAASMSYAGLTGDMSDSNFSSNRMGQGEEREQWMTLQEWLIEVWKKPEHEEFVYRAIFKRKIALPLAKIRKFERAITFRGRRWAYVNPIQDWQAKQIALDMCATSLTAIIEEQPGGDRDEVFDQIEKDAKDMEKRGIKRVHGTYQLVDFENPPPTTAIPAKKPVKPTEKQAE